MRQCANLSHQCKVSNFVKLVKIFKRKISEQENEVKTLKNRHQESIEENKALLQQFHQLNERETTLRKDLALKQEKEKELEGQVYQLWQVPSLFVMSSFDNLEDGATDLSEGTSQVYF